MIHVSRLVFLAALVLAGAAQAFSEGTGRISVLPGWRYTPNAYFAGSAQQAGFPLERASPGGPQLTASFGYMATDAIEVGIDLFGGFESLPLQNFGEVTSVTYGAELVIRGYFDAGSFHPYLGAGLGPVFAFTTGGETRDSSERLVTGYVVNAGVSWALTDRLAVTLDAKWLIARGFVRDIGGVNSGGLWSGIGVSWLLPGEASRTGSVR